MNLFERLSKFSLEMCENQLIAKPILVFVYFHQSCGLLVNKHKFNFKVEEAFESSYWPENEPKTGAECPG